jgi:hypothetical protein
VLERLVKLAHSISNKPSADSAPAARHNLEAELRPLDDQVRLVQLLFLSVGEIIY